MAFFKKNIWLAFYFIVLIWMLFFGAAAYFNYQTVYSEYTAEQKNITSLTANSLKALFRQYEVLQDVIINKLIQTDSLPEPKVAQHIIDSVIEADPSILGVAIIMPNGEAYVASSSTPLPPHFNLLDQKENRDSFQQTLEEDKMILGRTYYSKVLNTIAFPLRKAARDSDGKVLFVISTVINNEKGFKYFVHDKHHRFSRGSYLYRERDGYFQIGIANRTIDPEIFNYQIPHGQIKASIRKLESEIGMSYENIKRNELMVITDSHHPNINSKVTSEYLYGYGLWIETIIENKVIMQLFLKRARILLLVFAGSLVLIYVLFSTIASSEKRKQNALRYQASHDYLTKLHNRFYLDQHMKSIDSEVPFHLMFIDLDNFKAINDSYGHEIGDEVLKEVASILTKLVGKDDLLVRYSGDEFIIISFGKSQQDIESFGEEALLRLSECCLTGQYNFIPSASIGISSYPSDGRDLDELKRHADLAMYESKKKRNTITFFKDELKAAYLYTTQIEQELKHAVTQDELYMVYQPQITRDGMLQGVEALVRWENKKLGFIPPDKFISIAESCGEMPSIGEFIISRSFQDMLEVKADTGVNIKLSINVSVKQFQHENFYCELIKLVEQHSFKNIELLLEVTESLFIDDVIGIRSLMKKIKEKGIRISLDDFGTGYSSLSLLSELPIDELKIDKSFIDKMLTDTNTYAMVEGIISIAKRLNITTVAEGVETDEQREALHKLKCDHYQGYLFSKPLTAPDLKDYIRSIQ